MAARQMRYLERSATAGLYGAPLTQAARTHLHQVLTAHLKPIQAPSAPKHGGHGAACIRP